MHAHRPHGALALVLGLVLAAPALAGCLDLTGEVEPHVDQRTPARDRPAPSSPEPFTYTGTGCTEVVLFVTADAESVRAFVPARYTIPGEATGTVPLAVAVASCQVLAVAGTAGVPGAQSDVGVAIEAPDGSQGTHVYQLWQVASDAGLWGRLNALGVFGGPAPIGVEEGGDGGLPVPLPGPVARNLQASVAWGAAAYNVTATAAAGAGPSPFGDPVWWHDTAHGTVRWSYTFDPIDAVPATGEVSTAEHTALGHMIGGPTAQGTGFAFAFDMEVRVDLVDAAPTG